LARSRPAASSTCAVDEYERGQRERRDDQQPAFDVSPVSHVGYDIQIRAQRASFGLVSQVDMFALLESTMIVESSEL
jgi:hypothetical protein